MDKELSAILTLCSFASPVFALIVILVFKWLKVTRPARKRLQAQIASYKISQGQFAGRSVREWISVGDYQIFVHRITEQTFTANDKKQRVVYAEVEYSNRSGKENLSCRRNQWLLYDQNGYTYQAQHETVAPQLYRDKAYFGGDRFLNPGMNARGWFAFQVPDDAKIIVLQFLTAFIGTKTADIRVENEIELERTTTTPPRSADSLPQNDALFDQAARDFLGLLSNTNLKNDIAMAAEMAGLKLLRDTRVDLSQHTPGHILLNAVSEEAFQKMQRFVFTWAWKNNLTPGHFKEVNVPDDAREYIPAISKLETPFDSICQQHGIQVDQYPYVAATAALRLAAVGEHMGLLEAGLGQTMTLHHMTVASKTIPYTAPENHL